MRLLNQIAFLRRNFSVLLIVTGLALLGYVATEYGEMWWSQRQLERQWAEQQKHMEEQRASGATAAIDDGLTRLAIPKIDLSAVVVEGTGRKQLLLGPGHMEDTAAPGELGNSVITAHRDTFFRHIHELQKGDRIMVQRSGKTYVYEVTTKRIVEPTEVSVVKPTSDARLTLITCYPTYYIGPAPERLVVSTKLITEPTAATHGASANAPNMTLLPKDTSSSARTE